MSVRVAPPSVARGVGAKHTQRYEALKRELEEFCEKGPQVRILEVQSRGGGRPQPPPGPRGGDVPRSCARARQRAG